MTSQEHVGTRDDALVQVGQLVAERYEITKHLGAGGFAKVYRAFDRVIERDVAIKFLDMRGIHLSHSAITTILERFSREAKLAARVPHRNVVQIFDIGRLDVGGSQPYIVMELLKGYDLEEQLNEHGPIAPTRLIPLFIDCLDALGEAHKLGIVHKDLKPSNLFFSSPGERAEALRIVDFGIAHIKGGDQSEEGPGDGGGRLTATGQILGTLQYLAPEYIGAQIVSPALDVYQMALILVELLSGDRVIKTDNAFECLRIHTFGLLELPSYLLDSPLGPVLRKALVSEHTERYPDAAAFASALSNVDPAQIPLSPLAQGGAIRTATFLNLASQPHIARQSSAHHKPSTQELLQENMRAGRALDDTMAGSICAPSLSSPLPDLSLDKPVMSASARDQVARATQMSELDVAPQSSARLKLIAALIGVAIIALGFITAKLYTDAQQPQAPQAPLAPVASAAVISQQPPAMAAPDPQVAVNAQAEPKPTQAPLTAPADPTSDNDNAKRSANATTLVVSPAAATLRVDGETHQSPWRPSFKKRQRSIKVTVSAPQHVSQTITLKPGQGEVQLTLVPQPQAPKPQQDLAKIALEAAEQQQREAQALQKRREDDLAELKARQEAAARAAAAQERELQRQLEAINKSKQDAMQIMQ